MLLSKSDQPEVLWNLLAVTAEQEDAEAYSRYWRRYVKVQLYRLMRSEDRWAAYEELLKFYRYACDTCEQTLKAAATKVGERLRIPGLLSRWLEAQLALLWLDALVAKPQSGPPSPTSVGRHVPDSAAAMRFWFRSYYPEFLRHVSSGRPLEPDVGGGLPLSRLVQHPEEILVTRFAEWSRHRFGLDTDKDCPQSPALDAYAKVVASLDWAPYVSSAQRALRGEETRIDPFRRRMMDAIGQPLLQPLHDLRKQEDWKGIIERYSDESLLAVLPPIARLLVGVAHCELKQFDFALARACSASIWVRRRAAIDRDCGGR